MAAAGKAKNSEVMQKVDLVKDKGSLTDTHLNYMRLAQQAHTARLLRLQRTQRNNFLTAGILGLSVVGIFGYSIWAVGSEKFLEEDFGVKDKH